MKRTAQAAVLLICLAGAARGQGSDLPVEDLELPVATYPNGAVKTLITAARTYARAGGSVDATDVTVKYFEQDGSTAAVVEVGQCSYDREKETVSSPDAKIRVRKGTLAITGTGFDLKAREERVTILNDVRVVFRRESAVRKRKKSS